MANQKGRIGFPHLPDLADHQINPRVQGLFTRFPAWWSCTGLWSLDPADWEKWEWDHLAGTGLLAGRWDQGACYCSGLISWKSYCGCV